MKKHYLCTRMSRILSIDYGKKRTGIAVSDPLQLIANALATVETHKLLDFVADYMAHNDVERIVVGLPRQCDGRDSENLRRITPFVNRLRKLHPDTPVEYYDERFTTVLAHRAIIDGGVRKAQRRNDKGLADRVSATIILEDYMESRRLQVPLP